MHSCVTSKNVKWCHLIWPTLYVITIHQRYRRTDRQTDDMRSQYRALHKSASRGKMAYGESIRGRCSDVALKLKLMIQYA